MIVSTDSDEIAATARTLGADVPFLRPPEFARDETPMLDVVVDLVRTLVSREQYEADVLVLLQPTSPFRRPEHVDAAVDLLVASGADSVVTVVEVPHQFSPVSLFTLEGDRLQRWDAQGTLAPTRRQDKPTLFARNGPAVIAMRTGVVTEQASLYGTDIRALVMARQDSIDIDDQFDLELAELLLMRGAAQSRG